MEARIKTIAICSSASFYRKVLDIERALQEKGFQVKIPSTANRMKASGDFEVEHYKTWFQNPSDYTRKAEVMREHNKKIVESDAILVVNEEKKDVSGYIGGNVLMEMALAFHFGKPIYVLNPVSESSPFYEEILGMGSIMLNGDLGTVCLPGVSTRTRPLHSVT